jgi:hypothetical protein
MEFGRGDLQSIFAKFVESCEGDLCTLFSFPGGSHIFGVSDLQYIMELGVCSSVGIRAEWQKLHSTLLALNRRIESPMLSVDRSFIAVMTSLEDVVCGGVKSLPRYVESLSGTSNPIPQFQGLREEKQALSSLLRRAQQIQDFLVLPQLLSECISRSQFSDAWSLYEFSQRFLRRHDVRNLTAFDIWRKEIGCQRDNFVSAIDVALSTRSLRVQEVNNMLLIYRMMFPKSDLKLKFIEWRSTFYKNRKADIRRGDADSKRAKDCLEHLRVHLAEILSQFRSIFPASNGSVPVHPVLTRLIVEEVADIFDIIAETLIKVKPEVRFQFLRDILQQASGVKLFDMAPGLTSICVRYVAARIDEFCVEALANFKKEVSAYNWRPFMSLISESIRDDDPIALTRHRPIAVLFNDLTSFLNELREFPLISAASVLTKSIDHLLSSCLDILCSSSSAPSSEITVATHNFCLILAPSVEGYISSMFARKVTFSSLRSRDGFIQYINPEKLSVAIAENLATEISSPREPFK